MPDGTEESLERLLQAMGLGTTEQVVILVGVAAAIAIVRGCYVVIVGWHARRREFVELYQALAVTQPDALAIETAVRHGYGVLIPAAAIARIRALPFPSQCLLVLCDVIGFIEPDSTN